MVESNLNSAIYRGHVRHRRFKPKQNCFKYSVFMMYLDLSETDQVLKLSPFWSRKWWAPARFKRSDYFGDSSSSLYDRVQQHVEANSNTKIDGKICLLTNLRYFGFIINPISIFYCFNNEDKLAALLLEVTNTPWGETHRYVLECDPDKQIHAQQFDKEMHVSPFQPMNIFYDWKSNLPAEKLSVHMQNYLRKETENEFIFDATLTLDRLAISTASLNKIILLYPFMTLKVFATIYWQALKLYVKRIPFINHPDTLNKRNS